VCADHLNDLKAKIIHDSDVARRMIAAHGIESITDVVSVKPDILKELLYGDEHTTDGMPRKGMDAWKDTGRGARLPGRTFDDQYDGHPDRDEAEWPRTEVRGHSASSS
jgi:hypothetical protein